MVDRKRCPTCRQTLPHRAPDGLHLSPQQRVIHDIVRRAGDNGIGTDELIELAYRGARVPDTAVKVIHGTVWRINKQLVPKGYRIRGWNRGRFAGGEYFYVRLNGDACA